MSKRTYSDGEIEQQRLEHQDDPDAGKSPIVDWLLNAPEKNFFTPIESESIDSLKVSSRIKRERRK